MPSRKRSPLIELPAPNCSAAFAFFLEEKLFFWLRSWSIFLSPLGWVLSYLLSLALCGLVIQLFTLPVTLYYTNRWVWTQWVINLLLVPFSPFSFPPALFFF